MISAYVSVPQDVSFEEFQNLFSDDQLCAAEIIRHRWPNGFHCPSCGCTKAYEISTRRLPLFQCTSAHCKRQVSVTSGTIFEGSRTPLPLWFQAIYWHSRPGGISATQLAEKIGVTYKTAWLIGHKLRLAMESANDAARLQNNVQLSYGIYGEQFRGFSTKPQTVHPLVVGISVGSSNEPLQLMIRQTHEQPSAALPPKFIGDDAFVEQHIEASKASVSIFRPFRARGRALCFIGIVHQLNQWLNETFRGIGAKHLQAYLDQFCFTITRLLQNVPSSATSLLHWCSTIRKAPYKELIAYVTRRPILPPNVRYNQLFAR